jgi:hypothetical protein
VLLSCGICGVPGQNCQLKIPNLMDGEAVPCLRWPMEGRNRGLPNAGFRNDPEATLQLGPLSKITASCTTSRCN